jgi:hypothetical protein
MKKIDALLKKVEVFEKLAVYGDRKSFLKTLAQGVNAPYMPGTAPPVNNPPQAAGPDSTTVTLPTDHIKGKPPVNNPPQAAGPDSTTITLPTDHIKGKPPVQFDPRVKAVQSFINRQLVPAGIISPIDEDGKWGPETAGALKTWGDKNKLAGIPLNAVFTAAQSRISVQPTLDALKPGPNATV